VDQVVTEQPSRRLISLALFPFACGYFSSQLLRAVNAVIAPDLVRDFAIGPAELGFLTSTYLLTFSLFQLPLGVLLDRYGARRVQTMLLAFAAAGCLAFSAATNFPSLVVARAVIGLGFSAGLMASYKSTSQWVSMERRSLANASIMSMGALGIVVSTEPTSWLVAALGWRGAFLCFATFIAAAACFIFFAVPEKPTAAAPAPFRTQWQEMWKILKLPLFWRVAPVLGITAGLPIAYQTLWAGPWFRDVAGQNPSEVARSLFWVAVAFMVGSLTLGFVADRLQRRGIGPMQTLNGLLLLHTGAQILLVVASPKVAFVGWLILGAIGQSAILAFPWFAKEVGEDLSGRANATINFAMFITAFAAQFVVGYIISYFPPVQTGYNPAGYAWAFGLFLLLQIFAIAWYFYTMRQRSDI
jgi:predicted MFS family arabinose efflux permease